MFLEIGALALDSGTYLDAAGSTVNFLSGHLTAVSAAAVAVGAVWVALKKENLDVCKNIWVALEKDAKGVTHFRMFSEASVRISSLFPSDPILRWRLRRAARSAKPPTPEHHDIDYIPLGTHVSRLRRELAAFVSGAPLQWYWDVCKIAGSAQDPYAILLTEQYPTGADRCFRNILIHPATFAEFGRMTDDDVENVKCQRPNHIDLLGRLVHIAKMYDPEQKDSSGPFAAEAREAIERMTIMLPKAA